MKSTQSSNFALLLRYSGQCLSLIHIQMCIRDSYEGDHDELYFRDYLQEHPAVAKNYEQLKLSLWKQYEHNRDAYTDSKTDFIKKYTKEAKKLYGRRYEREDR